MQLELVKGLIGLATPVLAAVLLYFVGRYLTDRYNEQKKKAELALLQASQAAQKQRELQLLAANRFYQLYGEFFAVWKLWRAVKSGKVAERPEEKRAELHRRISTAEGEMEAVFVRLAAEYRLSEADRAAVGKFRQAYQSLRKAIGQDQDLGWHSSADPEYRAFKRQACAVANLLSNQVSDQAPGLEEARKALEEVTDNKWEGAWAK
jgi:hypothetical protein